MIAMFWMAAAVAQVASPPPPPPVIDEVVVVGHRKPFKLNVRGLRAAQALFDAQRDQFAPAASLRFIAVGRDEETPSPPPRLRLTDGTNVMPVALAADGSFTLPNLPAGKWWLTADLGQRQLLIKPLVRSPGSDRLDHRLGDARLQCMVYWTMLKANASLLEAPVVGMFDVVGACSSRRIGIHEPVPRPIRTAVLEEGDRSAPVQVGQKRRSYRLPLADRSFGNEARIRIAAD